MLKEQPRTPTTKTGLERELLTQCAGRPAALLVAILVVTLITAECATGRQAQGPVGSGSSTSALGTRAATTQVRVDSTGAAVATSAAAFDATAGAQKSATAAAQATLMIATPSPATITTGQTTSMPTAAPAPTSVPTRGPTATSTSTPGTMVYTANFENWDSGTKGAPYPARLTFDPATRQYHIALTDASRAYTYQTYTPEARYFADFRLRIDVRRIAGPESGGGYGVLFRALPRGPSDKASPDYAFIVRPQEQSFALNQLSANGSAMNVGKGTTPAIKAGTELNHLEVIAQGDRITLGVNDTTLGAYTASITQAGAIGLIVSSPPKPTGTDGMEAAFSNLLISPLPADTSNSHQ